MAPLCIFSGEVTCPIILLPSLSGGADRGPVRAGRLGGRGLARCVACPGPRSESRPRTCALAPGRAPGPGAGVAVLRTVWRAQARAPGRAGRQGARPARGSRTSAARLRTGGEEESPRTGDSNPGCNCLVRGYSPSMHFFWGGDMPHYSPPLPFRRGRAGCPCVLASPLGRPAQGSRTCALCGVPRPAPSHPLGCDSPAFLASLCSPFSGVFQFLDRYISLARKIGYVPSSQ